MASQRSSPSNQWTLALLCFAVSAASFGCATPRAPSRVAPGLRQFDQEFPALGARFHVTFFAPDAQSAAAAANAVAARLAELSASLSTDREDSELSRLCAAAGGPARKVGDDLFRVLELSQRIARRSDGAFDPTAAPYAALWARADEAGAEPTEQQLEVVRPLVGWAKLKLDSIERTAALDVPGMRLDPAGLSLGYAADRILEELAARGFERAFVETDVGPHGRVRRFGAPPPGQDGWGLKLNPPPGSRTPSGAVYPVANAAIASSSPHRLIDPLSGKAVTGRPVVVVLARTGAAASALATAAAVLGRERGETMVRSAGATALFDPPANPSAPPAATRRRK